MARSLKGTVIEEYLAVSRVNLLPGRIRVEFVDHRTVNVFSGLGDYGIVLDLLKRYCPRKALEDNGIHRDRES